MTEPLSPAARAVMDAWWNDSKGNRSGIAAVLRAVAERLGYDSVYDIVCDDGEPNYRVDVADLLAIAAELEGDHD